MWSELVDSIKNTGNPTIQSLAAHDAQIRAEALDFAKAKRIDNGEELLNESLSEAVKEYLLYGAHPLSTEEDSDDIWDDAELFNIKLTNGDVIDCSELADEVLDALKRYLSGQPILQSIPVKGAEAMSEPKIYRKKPVEIQAMQISTPTDGHTSSCWMEDNGYPYLLGDATHPETLRHPNQLPDDKTKPDKGHYIDPETGNLVIRTLEGDMQVSSGDYVIRGVNGEFYPCKPDIFAKTYEEAQQ
jgi:hypothetical protein